MLKRFSFLVIFFLALSFLVGFIFLKNPKLQIKLIHFLLKARYTQINIQGLHLKTTQVKCDLIQLNNASESIFIEDLDLNWIPWKLLKKECVIHSLSIKNILYELYQNAPKLASSSPKTRDLSYASFIPGTSTSDFQGFLQTPLPLLLKTGKISIQGKFRYADYNCSYKIFTAQIQAQETAHINLEVNFETLSQRSLISKGKVDGKLSFLQNANRTLEKVDLSCSLKALETTLAISPQLNLKFSLAHNPQDKSEAYELSLEELPDYVSLCDIKASFDQKEKRFSGQYQLKGQTAQVKKYIPSMNFPQVELQATGNFSAKYLSSACINLDLKGSNGFKFLISGEKKSISTDFDLHLKKTKDVTEFDLPIFFKGLTQTSDFHFKGTLNPQKQDYLVSSTSQKCFIGEFLPLFSLFSKEKNATSAFKNSLSPDPRPVVPTKQPFFYSDKAPQETTQGDPQEKKLETTEQRTSAQAAPIHGVATATDSLSRLQNFCKTHIHSLRYKGHFSQIFYKEQALMTDLSLDAKLEKSILKMLIESQFQQAPFELEFEAELTPQLPFKAASQLSALPIKSFLKSIGNSAGFIDGKLSTKANISGQMANSQALSHSLQGNIKIIGAHGIINPFAKQSLKSQLSTQALGFLGKVLSHSFGFLQELGTSSDFLLYLQGVPFDQIILNFNRKANDKVNSSLSFQNKEIFLSGQGSVGYQPTLAWLDQPIDIHLQLDAKGKLADLLDKKGYLSSKTNDLGYAVGPKLGIYGSLKSPDFHEILGFLFSSNPENKEPKSLPQKMLYPVKGIFKLLTPNG